ncbi:Vacuolar protein-sorting-associated protein 27 [Coemansia asiatica]|uniref:Vacuolar protein sorting-associated protein 27 n=1 Tax=Coemansia asiatica TaxID=1052880 RepID=A0A9W8CJM8_9FUNG|nr:Vacuolar protein-sorting-associated protein 27 [Coemansia asiatica]
MVTRLFYGNPIEDEINRLTDEGVPNHELEIASALNFADKVRSKEFSAKEVSRMLRKRLEHHNPVVQILTLNLIDICIKNGGRLIQLEISRREFIDQIVGLLESKAGRHYELTQLVLKLIQEWAHLFKNNTEMGYPCGVYERLKRSGYSFPKLDMISSGAMMETASPPEWEDSPVCQRCRTQFTFTNRKHHCRHCGKCFCNDCSSNTTTIPKFGLYDPVRVCHGCYLRLKKIVSEPEDVSSLSIGQEGFGSQSVAYGSNSVSNSKPTATNVPHVNEEEDEDLKRAIELSIQESQNRPNYADFTLKPIASQSQATSKYNSTPKPSQTAAAAPASSNAAPALYSSVNTYPTVAASEPYPLHSASADAHQNDDEDDPELLAAIEASLRDMPGNGVPDYALPSTNNYPQTGVPSNNAFNHNAYPAVAVAENDNGPPLTAFMPAASFVEEVEEEGPLTTTEKENVQLFESLLTRMRDGGQDIRYDPQIQYLHECIGKLHPRITEAIEGIDQKNKEFSKLHDRIVTAIKIYDQLLDKRLRPSSYIAPVAAAASANDLSYLPPTQQSGYAANLSFQQITPSPSARPVAQYQLPVTGQVYGHGSVSTPHNVQNPEQQAQVVPQPSSQTSQYVTQPQLQLQLQSQQQPQQPQQLPLQAQHSQSLAPMSAPPQGQIASYSTSSSGYVPTVATPFQHNQQPQQPAYLPAQFSSNHQQPTPGSKSPSINPYHAAPPAMSHVPSIPVLQPTPANAQSSTAATQIQSPAPVATVSVPEPEEAPLIEF